MNINLNGEWTVETDGAEYKINVPSALQSLKELGEKYPSDAMQNSYLGKAIYKRKFTVEKIEKICLITFNGIMPYGTVYINGGKVGTAEYCQAGFTFDISDKIKCGENTVEVVVEEKNLNLIGGMRFDLLHWSGIFDDVYVETKNVDIKEPQISYSKENETAEISAYISDNDITCELEIRDGNKKILSVEATSENNIITFPFSTSDFTNWSTDNPKLYNAYIKSNGEEISFRFGLRSFECCGNRLLLNGKPFYAFGGGDEYFSPTISPLRDKEIIRKRYAKIKEMGFNFYRFHTHSPTKAELEVCDETGIVVSAEIPVLSNFSRIEDKDTGLEILTNYIKQTRTHACILDYCLGNEGVQLLVKNESEHEFAKRGYKTIKANTSYQLAMLCFGYQGETPQIDNDIMTPHLWSQEFRWAYQGLAKTPWSFIEGALSSKPCIVHEFGKYGVWPNDDEDRLYIENGYRMSNVAHNDEIFENSNLKSERKRIIENSRKISTLCARTAFESMRRNSGISGYVYWTMFRMGLRAGGLCDDFGAKSDCDAQLMKNTANAPLGIFADRDYFGRTFECGEYAEFNITVSNFSENPVADAELEISLDKDTKVFKNINCELGEIAVKATAEFIVPQYADVHEMKLDMKLISGGKTIANNSMTLWACPNKKVNASDKIVYHLHNTDTEKMLKANINICVDLWSWISILTGCVIPEYGFIPEDGKITDYIDIAIEKMKPSLVICDKMDDVSDKLIKSGVPVLFVDNGNFDKELYPEVIPGNSFFDLNRFYAPFRTSWDEGNAATLIDGAMFGDCDDFADLRWYSAIEDSIGLMREKVIERLDLTDTKNTVRLVQRIKNKKKISKNSTVYFEKMQKRCINDCIYYTDGKSNGTKVAVTSLNLFNDAFGKRIFGRIIDNLLK